MAEEKKTYGLIFKKKQNLIKTIDSTLANVFTEEDEKPEFLKPREVVTTFGSSMSAKLSKAELDKAINEDPSVCQYDELYDAMEKNKQVADPRRNESIKKPKYVEDLLKAASFRKREKARRMDRKIQKERKEEGDDFDNDECFVTDNYIQKLQEREAEEKVLNVQDKVDETQSVSIDGNMSQFYRQYLLAQHDSRSINTANIGQVQAPVPEQLMDKDKTPTLSEHSDTEIDLSKTDSAALPKYRVVRDVKTDKAEPAAEATTETTTETKPIKERHYGISPRKNSQKLKLSPKQGSDSPPSSSEVTKNLATFTDTPIFIPLKNWKIYDRRNNEATIEETRLRYLQRKEHNHLAKYIVIEKD